MDGLRKKATLSQWTYIYKITIWKARDPLAFHIQSNKQIFLNFSGTINNRDREQSP